MGAATVTSLLHAWSAGDVRAYDRLFGLVYAELHQRAEALARRERDGLTLDATSIVHELYLRLGTADGVTWNDRAHFYTVAARAMRRLLVSHARQHRAQKRGGDAVRLSLTNADRLPRAAFDERLDALDEALDALDALDPRLAQLVDLRYFVGLTLDETADALGQSRSTVQRDWLKAKAWLYDALAAP